MNASRTSVFRSVVGKTLRASVILLAVACLIPTAIGEDWAQFRGPGGLGISAEKNLPLNWSESENIAWKIELPGHGSSSPITWGDHVYLTSFTGYGLVENIPGAMTDLRRHLICINRDDGKILWKSTVELGQRKENSFEGFFVKHGYATSTPVADESGVYVFFGISGAIHYSHGGEEIWKTDVGERTNGYGSTASPVLYEDMVILNAANEAISMIALNKRTGKEVWRTRTRRTGSWSTPLVVKTDNRHEVVHHIPHHGSAPIAALDPRTGKELWRCDVLDTYFNPSPIVNDGVIYAISYHASTAIRAGGSGDATASHVLWENEQCGSQICSPIYHDGHLYFTERDNFAYCVNARTGEGVYKKRFDPPSGSTYASAVLADGRIYYVTCSGQTFVIAAKPEFELLAHNQVDSAGGDFNASPAISNGQIFIRNKKYLYCIGTK